MGVRGLVLYLENYCPEACYEVNIGRLAQLSKCRNGDAKIVVDAQSCYSLWYQDLNWMIGLEMHALVNRLRDFVDSFKNYGIQLIFFFGGLTPENERKRWIQKQRTTIEQYHEVFDCLRMNDEGNMDEFNPIPVDMGLFSSYILKYILKCQVRMSVDECVNEIVDYVQEHNCFAILGQDTDFLLKQLNNAVVLSTKNFDVKTMTTLQYDPEKLAHHLGISREQLPLLALLTGSLIPLDTTISFHRRLCDINAPDEKIQLHKLMPAIGNYINCLPKYIPLERILKHIAKDLFGDSSRSELLETIYKSYASRKTDCETDVFPEDDEWFKILTFARDRHRTFEAPNSIYSIMNYGIFEWDHVFEDLRTTLDLNPMARDRPTSSVTRPLRQRLYGILLHEEPDGPLTVQEWCADNNYSYKKPTVVNPIQPNVHPGLMKLWSGNDNADNICGRWLLFLSSIDSSLEQARSQLPAFGDDIISCLSVYYLYTTKFLNKFELDAILATIATHHLNRQRRAHSLDFTLDLRASQISITFIRTYGLILTLLAACGYPIKLTPHNVIPQFDGKLFQLKYAKKMENDQDPCSRNALCENDGSCIYSFYRMRTFIRPETKRQISNGRK